MTNHGNLTRVGYGAPPVEHQFKPGQSGNPSGKRKTKPPASLAEAILAKLLEPLPRRPGTRRGVTRRRLGIRQLIDKARQGDLDALKNLIRIREEAGPCKLPEWRKVSFAEGLKMKRDRWDLFTDEYFAKQDAEKAVARKQARSDDIPLADLIDQELNRTIAQVSPEGKRRRVSMLQLIATHFANQHGLGNADVIKLLQKLIPEKRLGNAKIIYEVARPQGEWATWLAEQRQIEDRNYRAAMKELYPGRDFSKKE